jgi:hypothetical protein
LDNQGSVKGFLMKSPRIRPVRSACLLLLVFCFFALPALADYTVSGKFQYEDRTFTTSGFTGAIDYKAIRFADVQIVRASDSSILARGITNGSGDFSIPVAGSVQQQIRAVCVATSTGSNMKIQVVSSTSQTGFGSAWSVASNPIAYGGTASLTVGTITARADANEGRAFNIWDVLIDGSDFANSITGSYPSTLFTIVWSPYYQAFGAAYDSARKFAYIGPAHAQDDPVIYQQFGHFMANIYSKLDAPSPFPYSQLDRSVFIQTLSGDRQDLRVAWAEGVSLFLGASIRKYKGYPNPDSFFFNYNNTMVLAFDLTNMGTYIAPSFTYPPFKSNRGDGSILGVGGALWDITLQRDFADVWKVLDYLSKQTFAGFTMERFWDGWFSSTINNGSAAEMRNIFWNKHGIEFAPDSLEPDNSAASAAVISTLALPAAASGPKVVINEISLDDGGSIELYNAGNIEANLEGWFIAAMRATSTITATIPAVRLQPGQFVTFVGASTGSGRNSIVFPGTIPWQQGQDGACALLDPTNTGRDFVRWGSARYYAPGGTYFTGSYAPIPDPGTSIGRNFSAQDTDASSDWAIEAPTLGTYNLSGEEKHHTLYPAGDVDYVAINAKANSWYLAEALNLTNGADTVLEVLSSDGNTVLAANDDSSLGAGSQIVWKPAADGKYLIRARRYDSTANFVQYGSYDLRVLESQTPFVAGLPATLTVSKPGQGGKYATIAGALAEAYSGDTVEIVDSATYVETALQMVGKSITLRAQRGKTPVIDGRGNNQATFYISGKNVTLESLRIIGGIVGIYVYGGNAKIVNAIVQRTTEGSGPTGIQVINSDASANIVHSTVSNNGSGIIVYSGAKAKVTNSIVYGNTQVDLCEPDSSSRCIASGTAGAGLIVQNTTSSRSTYPGTNGNINLDPKFVNPTTDDYHLQSTSPAIDKADGTDVNEPLRDADGISRSLAGSGTTAAPDMGAYEYLNPSVLTVQAVFPQIAAGGTAPNPEYRTSIVAVNTGTAISTVRISLTQSDGSPFSVKVLNEANKGWLSAHSQVQQYIPQNGSSFDISVMPSGTIRVESSGPVNTLSGYAQLLSNLPLNGTALFKMVQGSTIRSEAGVGISNPVKTFIVYIDNQNNAESGYAVANTGAATAAMTLTLRAADGSIRSTKTVTLQAGRHFATFASQDFSPLTPGFEGTIEFVSDQPVFAVALRYDNTNLSGLDQVFSTIPVLASGDAATALYFPQVADGGTYRTNFILVNPGAADTTAHLEFYGDDGKPLGLMIGGSSKASTDIAVKAHGVARLLTDGTTPSTSAGWVKVTSPAALGGSAIFQTLSRSTITSEAGVAASPMGTRFIVYVETVASAYSGLAISNPNSAAVDVTLKLRNSAGIQVDTTTLRIPALGHVAGFFTQWFGNYPEFEGTLEVVASSPVNAVALRYDGAIFATLPVIVP